MNTLFFGLGEQKFRTMNFQCAYFGGLALLIGGLIVGENVTVAIGTLWCFIAGIGSFLFDAKKMKEELEQSANSEKKRTRVEAQRRENVGETNREIIGNFQDEASQIERVENNDFTTINEPNDDNIVAESDCGQSSGREPDLENLQNEEQSLSNVIGANKSSKVLGVDNTLEQPDGFNSAKESPQSRSNEENIEFNAEKKADEEQEDYTESDADSGEESSESDR